MRDRKFRIRPLGGILVFRTGYDTVLPREFLARFWETRSHSRTRDGCHMLTFGSRRDTNKAIQTNTKLINIINLKKTKERGKKVIPSQAFTRHTEIGSPFSWAYISTNWISI